MDLLTIISKLEATNMTRTLENISGFAGFSDANLCTWLNTCNLSVKVNNVTYGNVWKVFCNDDLDGFWYLVILQQFGGKVVSKAMKVTSISSLNFV